MKTNKIRIGTDVSLAVNLKQYFSSGALKEREVYNPDVNDFYTIDDNPYVNKKYELYYPNETSIPDSETLNFKPDGTPVSIRSIKAILVNSSRIQEMKDKKKKYEQDMFDHYDKLRKHSRFIARFPIEPAMECFHPTPYNICGCGFPTWRAYPRPYFYAPYHGFGVYPQWGGIYKAAFPPPMPPKQPEFLKKDELQYVAEVAATDHQNIVEVKFPAVHQLHTGVYSLVIIAKLYAPGFNSKNLKTVTIDIPNVFELVGTTDESSDTDVHATVRNVLDVLPSGENDNVSVSVDNYVTDGRISEDNSEMLLDRTDGYTIPIDISGISRFIDAD